MEDSNLNLFEIENFHKDQYLFHILFKIIKSDEKLIYTDHENYIIARSAKGYPVWIWTVDDINQDKLYEILNLLEFFIENEEIKITCKEELYYKIKDTYSISTYFEMGFLICKKLNSTKIASGFIDKPNYSDKITLANFWKDLCKEQNNIDISFNEALIEADEWLNNNNFYVWRNSLGKVVSLASYSVLENQAKISHVYTPLEERRKGFSKSLIYNITKMILEQELVPILYTNYNYSASNKLYKLLGYESKGYLINFQIKSNS